LPIFIFRILLKYSKIHEAILVGGERERTLREIKYLEDGLDRDKLKEFLEMFFPNISIKELDSYISVIRGGSNFRRFYWKETPYKYLIDFILGELDLTI